VSVAIIGGSGFRSWSRLARCEAREVPTPFATEPVTVATGALDGHSVVFLPRHGQDHSVPPHRINYRANIRALAVLQVDAVIAIATVGGITDIAPPGSLLIPDQILDYTWGRAHTFFDGDDGRVGHVDMSEPYCEGLRQRLLEAADGAGITLGRRGTYAATQGPRFETAGEIRRLEKDGADVVGMTGMPEAALAREAQLPYAAVALVVNPAAGKSAGGISTVDLRNWLEAGLRGVGELLEAAVPLADGCRLEVPGPLEP